jgi:hypothetical protein
MQQNLFIGGYAWPSTSVIYIVTEISIVGVNSKISSPTASVVALINVAGVIPRSLKEAAVMKRILLIRVSYVMGTL